MSNPYEGLTSTTRTPGRHFSRSGTQDTSIEARIGRNIEPRSDGCWIWTGGHSNGYGTDGRRKIHRFVYETLVGPIPKGHVLHHECEVKDCCNPQHLTPLLPGDHTAHHARLRREAS